MRHQGRGRGGWGSGESLYNGVHLEIGSRQIVLPEENEVILSIHYRVLENFWGLASRWASKTMATLRRKNRPKGVTRIPSFSKTTI